MSTTLPTRPGLYVLLGLAGQLGCAHGITSKPVRLSPTSQALDNEAGTVASIASEEDFFEAKLLYQALPLPRQEATWSTSVAAASTRLRRRWPRLASPIPRR